MRSSYSISIVCPKLKASLRMESMMFTSIPCCLLLIMSNSHGLSNRLRIERMFFVSPASKSLRDSFCFIPLRSKWNIWGSPKAWHFIINSSFDICCDLAFSIKSSILFLPVYKFISLINEYLFLSNYKANILSTSLSRNSMYFYSNLVFTLFRFLFFINCYLSLLTKKS